MVLTTGEIRSLLEGLKIRERTLVFIPASTGIRQSELFALEWDDLDLSARTLNVARSIVHGFVGPRKTESSKKPVPIHPLVCEALVRWKEQAVSDDLLCSARLLTGGWTSRPKIDIPDAEQASENKSRK